MNLFKITFIHRVDGNIIDVEMYHHKGIKEISEEIFGIDRHNYKILRAEVTNEKNETNGK